MDLIDILWRQDIDLGVAKDFYDVEIKKKSEDIVAEQTVLQTLVDDSLLLPTYATYPVDNETGEYLFMVPPPPQSGPVSTAVIPGVVDANGVQGIYSQPAGGQVMQGQGQVNVSEEAQLEEQLIELLQMAAADINNSTEMLAEMPAYTNQTVNSSEPSGEDELQSLDDIDIDALLHPVSGVSTVAGTPVLQREISLDSQWNHLLSLWNNNTATTAQQPMLLRDNVSMTMGTNPAGAQWLPAELLENASQLPQMELMPEVTFSPSVSFTNVTDSWPDALLTQLLDTSNANFDGTNDTSAEGAVARIVEDNTVSQKYVGAWSSAAAYDGLESASDDSTSYSASPDQQIKTETPEWRHDSEYNDTQANMTSLYSHIRVPASSLRPTRGHSTSSSLVSEDSMDSAIGAQHNHTYTSAVLPPSQETTRQARARAARAAAAEEMEDLESSRDVKRLQELSIPLSYEDIVGTSVDKFNRMMQYHRLSDAQVQFIRDVRRRGKNKVAAQNCRKRKLDVIQTLDGDVSVLQQRKADLAHEKMVMMRRMDEVKMKMKALEDSLLRSLRGNDNAQLTDPDAYRLQLTNDGALYVVPTGNATDETQSRSNSKNKKKSKKSE